MRPLRGQIKATGNNSSPTFKTLWRNQLKLYLLESFQNPSSVITLKGQQNLTQSKRSRSTTQSMSKSFLDRATLGKSGTSHTYGLPDGKTHWCRNGDGTKQNC